MWRRAAAALVMALTLMAAVGAARIEAQEQTVTMTAQEQRFCDLINQERAKRGLSMLKPLPILITVARSHSREMSELNYFSHYSPSKGLRTPMDRYKAFTTGHALPAYLCVGENLYWATAGDPERGHTALMASPTHKENILRAEYQYVGIGVYTTPDGQMWATEMFMSQHS